LNGSVYESKVTSTQECKADVLLLGYYASLKRNKISARMSVHSTKKLLTQGNLVPSHAWWRQHNVAPNRPKL